MARRHPETPFPQPLLCVLEDGALASADRGFGVAASVERNRHRPMAVREPEAQTSTSAQAC